MSDLSDPYFVLEHGSIASMQYITKRGDTTEAYQAIYYKDGDVKFFKPGSSAQVYPEFPDALLREMHTRFDRLFSAPVEERSAIIASFSHAYF